MTRAHQTILLLAIICYIISGCETHYGEGDHIIYKCSLESKPILTTEPCNKKSSDYLLLTHNGGVLSSFQVYLDLCNTRKVTIVGLYEVIGDPSFEYKRLGWYQHGQVSDSLNKVYTNSDCKYFSTF